LKEKGLSTLGGRKIWFDEDVLRLNADNRGKYLGEFTGDDKILVVDMDGAYQVYSYDLENHFEKNLLSIEKFHPGKVASVVYFDAEQGFYYVKRFQIETNGGKPCRFIGEESNNKLVSVTWVTYPRLEIEFGGEKNSRENEIVEVAEFIGVKSYKAKGKRLSSFEVKDIHELEPIIKDEDIKPEEKVLPTIIDDVPFEIIRSTGNEYDPSQMKINFD
jgi:topoisomerase-4 subunit A